HWRGSSEDIRNRVTREYAAGRYDADVAETAGPDMEAMVREQVLQKMMTPVSKELIPQATTAIAHSIATWLSVFARAYNTNIIKPADAPKTYEDLLQPRFKGKLGIEAEDANWFMSVVLHMGEAKGLKLFRDVVAVNGMSVRKGHTLLANLVPTGEVPLALTAYSYRVEQLKKEGAPVEIVPAAGGRLSDRHRHVPPRTASACLAAVHRFYPDRRAEDPRGTRGGADQPHDQAGAARPDLRRSAALHRRGREVDAALPRNLHGPLG